MAEENTTGGEAPKKGGFNIKVLLIGLPLFIIQLVVVYLVTANVLLEKMLQHQQNSEEGVDSALTELVLEEEVADEPVELGKFVYSMDDLVVNIAGTNAQKFLLLSLGFDVPSAEMSAILEGKRIVIKDMILSYLSTKTLNEVTDPDFKELLKEGLITSIQELIPGTKINTIYYSKYIIN